MNNAIKTTSSTRVIFTHDGWDVKQTTFRVNRKICCYMEEYKDRWRIAIGKPADSQVLCWYYPKTEKGKKEADEKIQSIVDSTVTWYRSILN